MLLFKPKNSMIDVKDRGSWRPEDLYQGDKEETVFTVTKSEHGRPLPSYGF